MVAGHGGFGEGIDPLVVVEGHGPKAVIRRPANLPIGGTDPDIAGQVQMSEPALLQEIDGFFANRAVTMEERNLSEGFEPRRDRREEIVGDRYGGRQVEPTFNQIASPPEDLRIAQVPYGTEETAGFLPRGDHERCQTGTRRDRPVC